MITKEIRYCLRCGRKQSNHFFLGQGVSLLAFRLNRSLRLRMYNKCNVCDFPLRSSKKW